MFSITGSFWASVVHYLLLVFVEIKTPLGSGGHSSVKLL